MVVAPADYYAWEVFVIKTGKVLERVHDGCKEKFIQEILTKLGYEESQIGFRHFAEDKQTLPEYLGQVRSVFVTSSSGGGDPEN